MLILVTFALLCSSFVAGLDNGLARTPPMGWLTWERFRCNLDCVNDPDNCIGEKLIKDMTDRMAADGYLAAGYEYVIIDDCWLSPERTPEGQLQPDPKRFPSGIKALADYVHSKGLKFGIYEDFGTKTCAGYPGSEYYLQMDAQTFADWGVDFLKLDGCNSDVHQYDDAYPAMSLWLNRTGRPMVYSCSWPAYQEGSGIKPNYTAVAQACNIARNWNDIDDSWGSVSDIVDYYGKNVGDFVSQAGPGFFNDPDEPDYKKVAAACNLARNHFDMEDSWDSVAAAIEVYGANVGDFISVAGPGFWNDPDMPDYKRIAQYCNVWRNYGDISDSWSSVSSIIDFYGKDATGFVEVAGPGNFNDPDMLIVGDFGLSVGQQYVQMGMWAIMASPLIMSVDLRTIDPVAKSILLNKNVLAINQDPLGKQGHRLSKSNGNEVWVRPLSKKSFAFALLNTGTGGTPSKISIKLSDMGLANESGYNITEAFTGKYQGLFKQTDTFVHAVNPTGIFLGKAVPLP